MNIYTDGPFVYKRHELEPTFLKHKVSYLRVIVRRNNDGQKVVFLGEHPRENIINWHTGYSNGPILYAFRFKHFNTKSKTTI